MLDHLELRRATLELDHFGAALLHETRRVARRLFRGRETHERHIGHDHGALSAARYELCVVDHFFDGYRYRRAMALHDHADGIADQNEIYRRSGAVHGCALCEDADSLMYTEDVGRHNAADAISGYMWLDNISGAGKIFYTTGRLTSEIVMKTALMGISVLLSRSGVTHMGLELAQELGVTMIARARGKHFMVYHGADNIIFDAQPEPRKTPAERK